MHVCRCKNFSIVGELQTKVPTLTSVDYWHSVTNFNSPSSSPGNHTCLGGQDLRCKDWLLTNSVIWAISSYVHPMASLCCGSWLECDVLAVWYGALVGFPRCIPHYRGCIAASKPCLACRNCFVEFRLGRIHNRHVASLDIFSLILLFDVLFMNSTCLFY